MPLVTRAAWSNTALADAIGNPLTDFVRDPAQKQVNDLEYPAALKTLEAARKAGNTDRETTVRLAALHAITLATLGQEAKALKAFQFLLAVSPDFKLAGNYPPRVTTVFYEARGSSAAIEARQLPAVAKAGLLPELVVELAPDPLKLVKEVRFSTLVDGKLTVTDVAVNGPRVVVPANVQRLSWWAVLLGEQKMALKELSSAASPRIEAAAPLPVSATALKTPQAVSEPPPRPAEGRVSGEWAELPRPMSAKRIAAIGVLSGAAVALGIGVGFGVASNGTKARVAAATTDSAGRITGLTQREALALDAQQRTEATVANVLIISGAALAAGGAALIIFSRDDESVALVPAGGGVGLVGRF